MAIVANTELVDEERLGELLAPRDDLVVERAVDDHTFEAVGGPFRHYRRTVRVEPAGDPDGDAGGRGRHRVTETTEFTLALPVWGVLFLPPVKRALRRRGSTRSPFWAPPDRLDPRAGTVLAVLCTVSLLTGYLGTLITQTITFAARDFDVSTTAQSTTLAGVRVGVLGSLLLVSVADRRGRRRMMLAAGVAACLSAAVGALASNLWWLGASQTVSRAFTTAMALLVGIVAAEEMPAGSRAYALSVMAMTAALGAGMCVWVVALADVDEGAWRLAYLVPLLGLPVLRHVARRLPESRRFEAPHEEVGVAGHGRRLWLLAVTFFFATIFSAPASQLQNEFLRDERGFSAPRISLFTLATGTPGVIGIIVGGRLADVRGRRLVAAIGTVGGASLTVLAYLSTGAPLWLLSTASVIVAAATIPSLGVYQPELFPTSLRGRANGLITVVAVLGSSTGLIVAGIIADRSSLGEAMAVLLVGPLLVGLLVLTRFPETARVELEELNPEDRVPPSSAYPLRG